MSITASPFCPSSAVGQRKKSSKKQPENLELEMNRFIKFSSLFSRLQTKKKEKGTS